MRPLRTSVVPAIPDLHLAWRPSAAVHSTVIARFNQAIPYAQTLMIDRAAAVYWIPAFAG